MLSAVRNVVEARPAPGGQGRTAARGSAADRVAVMVLGAAVVCAALRQGAFYPGDAALMLALVLLAAVIRCRAGWARIAGPSAVAIAALLAAAAWTISAAALHRAGAAAVAPAAVLGGVALATAVAVAASPESAHVLRTVAITVGTAVALAGWGGVVLHIDPLALVSSGLWRASSTLTYANATAAFLVITLLLVVMTVPARALPARAVAAVLLLGLLATMSRAGLISGVVGLAVCACSVAGRARLRTLWPAVVAAAVAAAGLVPALPDDAPARPLPALAGLAAGAGVLLLARWAGRRRALLVAMALVGITVLAGALATGAAPAALATVAGTRFTAESAERDDLTTVTFDQFATSPLIGIGPGRLDLVYLDHTGTLVSAEFTHDEYLQTAAETGVVGLVLVLAAFAALGVGALRRWSSAPAAPGALAILAAFGLHSAFDFLWHIPVLPLFAAIAAAPLLARPIPDKTGRP